jgi:hypothetical protein
MIKLYSMKKEEQPGDLLEKENPAKLPELLNVLTILTFLGCGFGLITTVWSFAAAKSAYETVQHMNESMGGASALARKLTNVEMAEVAQKSFENRLPILLFGLAGLACCTWGAIQMRKLRKAGFYFWTVGELLPVLSTIFFIGGRALNVIPMFLTLLLPTVFFLLYATQRKYMVN